MKKFLSALLCAALMLGLCLLPAQAAPACGCGEVLQVFMDGWGQDLFYDEGTPGETKAEMADTSQIWPNLPAVLWGAVCTLFTGNWDYLAKGAAALVLGMMGSMRMDENGQSVLPITSHWKLDPAQDHRTRPEFYFRYDYRLDLFDIAAELNDFIETLCKQTGHGKIALTGHSEGAAVAMTYLKVYGTKRLETLILANGGWQGLTMAGQLISGQFDLPPAALTNYIANNDDGSGLLAAGMDMLRASRLLDITTVVAAFARGVMMESVDRYVLLPLLCQIPAIWAFVPDEYYAAARQAIAGEAKYAKLLAGADRYHKEVSTQAKALLDKAMKDGVKVAVMCSYGFAPLPITRDAFYPSDGLIDTAREAGGATYAPIGQTLPPGDSKYRSPDGVFDAATCILPDQTWFVKYNGHNHRPFEPLRQWVIHAKRQPTVWDNPAFPQYLRRAGEFEAVPLGSEAPPAQAATFAQAARAFAALAWERMWDR